MGLMMIPDTAHTFPELSDGVSKPNFIPDFIYNSLEDLFNVDDFEHILYSDNPIDEDLYPSSLDDDFYNTELNDDDQFLYNLHEEPYQEKLNAAAIEAAAFKSYQVLFSPELCHIVNPNEIFADHNKKEVKIKVTDEFVLNNTRKSDKDGEIVYVRGDDEVHNDHSYVKEGEEEVVVKVEIKEEVIDEGYNQYENVVVKTEPAVKRPVGRPRKTPIASKPIKRSAFHFDEVTNEEIVDVESIDVKRPRKAPRTSKAPKKAIIKQRPTKVPKPSPPTSEDSSSPTHYFQSSTDPLNPNGYVMRQAKTSAIKKMVKTNKKGQAVSRSKRSDHNDMERKRRHEMRDLFEELKVLVPMELLVDDNNKIKKNPSKNTILVGSRKYIEVLYGNKTSKNSLTRQNQKLQKRRRRLEKSLRKRCKKLMSRRNFIC